MYQTTDKSRSAPARVMIAEDSRTQATRLRMVLEEAGYDVDVATDGAAALEALTGNGPFDLLITDVQMPEMSGFELCRLVKASDGMRDLPVMILTALRDPVDIVNGLSAGADNFLTKPFAEADLLRRVQHLLATRRSASGDDLQIGTQVRFGGRQFTITAEKQQIVNLLISAFEEIVSTNLALEHSRAALREANARVEDYARRLAEGADDRYRQLLQKASDGILVTGEDGLIRECNSRAYEILGRSEAHIIGHRLAELEDTTQDESSSGSQPVGDGPITVRELSIVKGDGSSIRIEATSGELDGQEEESIGIIVIRDVTERHRQTSRLRQAIDAVADSILIVDRTLCVTLANKEARRVIAPGKGTLLGRDLRSFLFRPDGSPLNNEHVVLHNARNRHKRLKPDQGDPIDVEVNTGPLSIDNEPYIVCSFRDITDRLRIEQQIRQSQKLEAIGRLAGGVAHDFNNLLSVINGYADMILAQAGTDSPLHQHAIEIRRAGDSAAAMTRQLLSVGRPGPSSDVDTDLNQVVTSAAGTLVRLAGDTVRVDTDLCDEGSPVRLDPSKIEQVLLNMVVNARDAMPDGGTVTIETRRVTVTPEYASSHIGVEPGPYMRLSITDTGTGMDAETQSHLFEPFFTTKPVGKGTGLGLATVHSIVRQCGGDIRLYSEVGHGTAFHLFFPCVDSPVQVEPQPQAAASEHETEREDDHADREPSGQAILVVDDNQAVRELTVMLLEDAGYNVSTAADGQDALQLLESGLRVELVISDVVMPKMSGRELAGRLRDIAPDLPVLFVSGYTEKGARTNGHIEESIEFLQKPYTATDLRKAVSKALAQRRK